MKVDGSGVLPVMRNQESDLSPFWSTDSRTLIFSRLAGGARVTLTKRGEVTDEEKPLLQGTAYPSPEGKYLLIGNSRTNSLNQWRPSSTLAPTASASLCSRRPTIPRSGQADPMFS